MKRLYILAGLNISCNWS